MLTLAIEWDTIVRTELSSATLKSHASSALRIIIDAYLRELGAMRAYPPRKGFCGAYACIGSNSRPRLLRLSIRWYGRWQRIRTMASPPPVSRMRFCFIHPLFPLTSLLFNRCAKSALPSSHLRMDPRKSQAAYPDIPSRLTCAACLPASTTHYICAYYRAPDHSRISRPPGGKSCYAGRPQGDCPPPFSVHDISQQVV